MKITVELPDAEWRAICEITGIQKKGPAIRKLLADAVRQQQRAIIAQKFVSGEWSAEFEGYESAKVAEKQKANTLAEQWRD